MDIRPDYANLKVGDEIRKVSPEEVNIGDIIIVKPGEKVPLDGKVIEGNSMVDTAALTGESVPRDVYKRQEEGRGAAGPPRPGQARRLQAEPPAVGQDQEGPFGREGPVGGPEDDLRQAGPDRFLCPPGVLAGHGGRGGRRRTGVLPQGRQARRQVPR